MMMAKIILSFLLLYSVLFMQSEVAKAADPGASHRIYRSSYYTYEVVEVTEKTVVLQRTKKNQEVVSATIDRSRRPSLKVGDQVRYDKINDRLRKTLPEK
jgi:hypothetical protein